MLNNKIPNNLFKFFSAIIYFDSILQRRFTNGHCPCTGIICCWIAFNSKCDVNCYCSFIRKTILDDRPETDVFNGLGNPRISRISADSLWIWWIQTLNPQEIHGFQRNLQMFQALNPHEIHWICMKLDRDFSEIPRFTVKFMDVREPQIAHGLRHKSTEKHIELPDLSKEPIRKHGNLHFSVSFQPGNIILYIYSCWLTVSPFKFTVQFHRSISLFNTLQFVRAKPYTIYLTNSLGRISSLSLYMSLSCNCIARHLVLQHKHRKTPH